MPIYMSVKGAKQGIIPGDSTSAGHKNYWDVSVVTKGCNTPYDQTSGLPSGRRIWQLVTVTIPFAGHVTSLYEAMTTNETLVTVFFQFYDSSNVQRARMTLTNASLLEIADVASGGPPVTTLSFGFQKIEYIAATTFDDDFAPVV